MSFTNKFGLLLVLVGLSYHSSGNQFLDLFYLVIVLIGSIMFYMEDKRKGN